MSTTKPLTPKQQRFVEEWLIDHNGTKAAIRAGYSEKTAHAQASRLLKDVKISDAIMGAVKKQMKRVHVDQDFVINGLALEAQGKGEDTTASARVRAYELLGKHLGIIVERKETGKPGDFENLTDEELDEEIRDLQQSETKETLH